MRNRGEQLSDARVLVADDNTAILDRVSDLLHVDYEVIGKVAEGGSVCSAVKALKPDVIILDISFGDYSGIKIAGQLREQGYPGEIVFLTVHVIADSGWGRVECFSGPPPHLEGAGRKLDCPFWHDIETIHHVHSAVAASE